MRRNGVALAAVGMIAALIVGVTVAFTDDPFARGLIVGAGTAGTLGWMWLWIVQSTGTAPTIMGDLGEQWTAQELRRLRRRGWLLVNHVTLAPPDADHVLVGPGGMFAIETKWSAERWTVGDPRIIKAVDGARSSARRLTLWQDLKSVGVGQVRPVVFLWGAGARDLPGIHEVAGATVVPGPSAKVWLAQLGTGQLSPEQVDAAWRALESHCRRRDPKEAEAAPLPLSLWEWAARAVLGLTAACTGFLAAAASLTNDLALPWTALCWVAMLVAGALAVRVAAIRYLAIPWTLGVLVVVVPMAIALLIESIGLV